MEIILIAAVSCNDVGSELFCDLRYCGLRFCGQRSRDCIRVYDVYAKFGKQIRDRGFAGTDATRQSDCEGHLVYEPGMV